jgi:hypothetical protein
MSLALLATVYKQQAGLSAIAEKRGILADLNKDAVLPIPRESAKPEW